MIKFGFFRTYMCHFLQKQKLHAGLCLMIYCLVTIMYQGMERLNLVSLEHIYALLFGEKLHAGLCLMFSLDLLTMLSFNLDDISRFL